MIIPMYVAECAPPELRGFLIGIQQLAIEFGIMVSFWIVRLFLPIEPAISLTRSRTMARISSAAQAMDSRMQRGWCH